MRRLALAIVALVLWAPLAARASVITTVDYGNIGGGVLNPLTEVHVDYAIWTFGDDPGLDEPAGKIFDVVLHPGDPASQSFTATPGSEPLWNAFIALITNGTPNRLGWRIVFNDGGDLSQVLNDLEANELSVLPGPDLVTHDIGSITMHVDNLNFHTFSIFGDTFFLADFNLSFDFNTVEAVPEPASMTALLGGGAALLLRRRRR